MASRNPVGRLARRARGVLTDPRASLGGVSDALTGAAGVLAAGAGQARGVGEVLFRRGRALVDRSAGPAPTPRTSAEPAPTPVAAPAEPASPPVAAPAGPAPTPARLAGKDTVKKAAAQHEGQRRAAAREASPGGTLPPRRRTQPGPGGASQS